MSDLTDKDINPELHVLAKRIAEVRGEKDWTQREFASRLGTSQSYVAALEACRKNITYTVLAHIARTLDVPIASLQANTKVYSHARAAAAARRWEAAAQATEAKAPSTKKPKAD